jgi:hypothetical protein
VSKSAHLVAIPCQVTGVVKDKHVGRAILEAHGEESEHVAYGLVPEEDVVIINHPVLARYHQNTVHNLL